jgi:DNA polymerase III delta subunit
MVEGLNLVYFLTFTFLLLVNFGSMTHLGRIEQKLTKSIKIFSHFSLIFRNIPRYMDSAQFKKALID